MTPNLETESGPEQEPILEGREEAPVSERLPALNRLENTRDRLLAIGGLEDLATIDLSSRRREVEETLVTAEDPRETIVKKEDRIIIGGEIEAPIVKPEKVSWQPKLEPTADKRFLRVGFQSSAGGEWFSPDFVTQNDDLEDPEVKQTIGLARQALDKHLEALPQKGTIPERDPQYIEIPYAVSKMAEFADLVNQQLQNEDGIVIIRGDAGVGKDKLVEHYAHLSERPLFRFQCSAGKDEPDLKYLLEYSPEKGTYRIKSTVVEALEVPNALLVFDEMNTLKPEIAKLLNPLCDFKRTLYFGENDLKVKAANGVVLVGLMNPEHYAGVADLAETIRDRAQMMEMDYPPLVDKEGKYQVDEALILRQYVAELSELSRQEFRVLWSQVANRGSTGVGLSLLTQKREECIDQILEILKIADKVRGAYRSFHEGSSEDEVNFTFSLRASRDCARALEKTADAKEAVKKVILPKIPQGEERIKVADIINET